MEHINRVCLIGGSMEPFKLFRLPLIKALLESEDTIVTCINWGKASDEPFHHPRLSWHHLGGSHLGKNPIRDLKQLKRLTQILKHIKPTALLSFNAKPIVWSSLLNRLHNKNTKHVVLLEGLGKGLLFLKFDNKIVYHFLFKTMTESVHNWIFLNERDQGLLTKIHQLRADETSLQNGIGIDLTKFKPTTSKQLFNNKRLIFVGRLIPEKGVYFFIDLARRSKQIDGSNWKFSIAGMTPLENRVNASEIQSWREEGLIEDCRSIENMPDFYHQATALIYPSIYEEGLPASIMEAQACGLPCLIANTHLLSRSIKDNVSGYALDLKDPSEWLEKIKTLEDEEKFNAISLAATKHAIKQFDMKIHINQTIKLLKVNQ